MNTNTRYAKGSDGTFVEAKKGMMIDQRFTCVGCGDEVRAYAIHTEGPRSQSAHFRHLHDGGNGGCGDSESYIHAVSKNLFAKVYKEANSFLFTYKRFDSCKHAKDDKCGKEVLHTVDLKKHFPYIKVEKRDGSFIPDCMIYNKNDEKTYIEVKYRSPASPEKIKSGIRIIEIEVADENQMLRIIKNDSITEENSAIKLYNINRKGIKTSTFDCQGQCINEVIKSPTSTYTPTTLLRPKPVKRIYNTPKPQKRPEIIGTQRIQLFRPKQCFKCNNHPTHYMNVGRVFVDNEFNVASIEDELFKDEIVSSKEFSIATRVSKGNTNSYYCPICGNWLANNRLLKGTYTINKEDRILRCQVNLFE